MGYKYKLVRVENSETKEENFLRKVIKTSIRSVMAYTIASFVMVWVTGNQPPDALTVAFFAYWSFENGASALIETVKKRKKKNTEGENTDEC